MNLTLIARWHPNTGGKYVSLSRTQRMIRGSYIVTYAMLMKEIRRLSSDILRAGSMCAGSSRQHRAAKLLQIQRKFRSGTPRRIMWKSLWL